MKYKLVLTLLISHLFTLSFAQDSSNVVNTVYQDTSTYQATSLWVLNGNFQISNYPGSPQSLKKIRPTILSFDVSFHSKYRIGLGAYFCNTILSSPMSESSISISPLIISGNLLNLGPLVNVDFYRSSQLNVWAKIGAGKLYYDKLIEEYKQIGDYEETKVNSDGWSITGKIEGLYFIPGENKISRIGIIGAIGYTHYDLTVNSATLEGATLPLNNEHWQNEAFSSIDISLGLAVRLK